MATCLPIRVEEIARRLEGEFEGCGETQVIGAAPLEAAGPQHIAFLARESMARQLEETLAGCVLVPRRLRCIPGRSVIRVDNPRLAFARVLGWFDTRPTPVPGIHPTAIVHATACLGRDVCIGPYCIVGSDAEIGDESILHARVTLYDGVRIGKRCVLHAGAVLGADGFGFVQDGDHYEKLPHVGYVEIGDDVEIGANSTVDRGTIGPTTIGSGTKIDNLVQIAHNCMIGRNVVIAAQSGIAGSACVGDWVVIGGQVGIGDKARIEARAVLGAASAVPTGKHVPAGQPMWGVPARPLRKYLRQLATLGCVEKLRSEIRGMRRTPVGEDTRA
jgi:UDP-3-O-[3-hydroxymyristoyl] glucosamine N-acyltransferase